MASQRSRVVERLSERLVELSERLVWRAAYYTARRLLRRLLASRIQGVKPPRAGGVSLYIHVPFCRRPCRFCCFVRFPANAFNVNEYYGCLRRELETVLVESEARITYVHVGGGTPAIEPYELLETVDVIKSYQRGFQLAVELHPKDVLTEDGYSAVKALRADRLSLGVQSFDDRMLARLGRLSHTGREALEAAKLCSRLARTVNIDLVWAVPGQSIEEAVADLRTAICETGANQVTIYPLLAKTRIRHPAAYRMYCRLVDEAVSRGWRPVTPWTFARGEQLLEYIYEALEPRFIGVGLSSISILDGRLYANTFNLKRYCELASRGRWTVSLSTRMNPAERLAFGLLNTLEVIMAAYASLALSPRMLRDTGLLTMYLAGEARRAVYSALALFRAEALAAAV